MFPLRLSLIVSLLVLFGARFSDAQVRSEADKMLRDTKVSYVVTHADSTTEHVVVKYEAFLYHRVWQSGSVAKPLEGKLTDDRRCHFTVRARVFRRAYMLTRRGIPAPVEEYQAVYDASSSGARGPENKFESITRKVTCGDVNNFSAQIADAEASLIDRFDSLVAKDDDKSRNRLREMLLGSAISVVGRP